MAGVGEEFNTQEKVKHGQCNDIWPEMGACLPQRTAEMDWQAEMISIARDLADEVKLLKRTRDAGVHQVPCNPNVEGETTALASQIASATKVALFKLLGLLLSNSLPTDCPTKNPSNVVPSAKECERVIRQMWVGDSALAVSSDDSNSTVARTPLHGIGISVVAWRLCGILLDVSTMTGCQASDLSESVDLAFAVWPGAGVFAFGCVGGTALIEGAITALLEGLANAARSGKLSEGSLRRIVVMGTEAFHHRYGSTRTFSWKNFGIAPSAAADAVVAAIASSHSRIEAFEILFEALFRRNSSEDLSHSSTSARSVVCLLSRALAAVCAPRPTARIFDFLPAAYAEARHCARVASVGLVRRASASGSVDGRPGFEMLVAELATESLRPEKPAAMMLLRSLSGTLTTILRSRRGSCEMKVLAVRAMGKAASRLESERAMMTATSGHANPHVINPIRGARGDANTDEKVAAADPFSLWVRRRSVLENMRLTEPCATCPSKSSSRIDAESETDEALYHARSFVLCKWATDICDIDSDIVGREGKRVDASTVDVGRQFIEDAWRVCLRRFRWANGLSPNRAEVAAGPVALQAEKKQCVKADANAESQRCSQSSLACETVPREVCFRESLCEVEELRDRMTRAMVSQLRSPRAGVRAAALRALAPLARDNFALFGSSRQAVIAILARDPSAAVRHAALGLVGHWLPVDASKTIANATWAISVVRRCALTDASTAVRMAARRLLGRYIRCCPGDANAASVCGDLVRASVDLDGGARSIVTGDLRAYVLACGVGMRGKEILHILSLGHCLGVKGLVSGLFRTSARSSDLVSASDDQDSSGLDAHVTVREVVHAFTNDPCPSLLPGLLAISEAVPWTLTDHLQTLAAYLAIRSPPRVSEEVLAQGACTIVADVLAASGPGSTRALNMWAWARLHSMVKIHSSRLARPAMRCLCAAAEAEADPKLLLVHLCGAAKLLRAERLSGLSGSAGLPRAAWLVATACEFCDLDSLLTFEDLDMAPIPTGEQLVGRALAADLLFVFSALSNASQVDAAAASALVLALGFAMRRHTWLAASVQGLAALASGLAGPSRPSSTAGELLAERTLETFESLLLHAKSSGQPAQSLAALGGPAEVMSNLSKLQPEVLSFLSHGLHRRAEPADVPLRTRALAAARAFDQAGLGHSQSMASALFGLLFADRTLRRSASMLLCSVAQRAPNAVAGALVGGLREGFCAMLWQCPQQLLLAGSPSLVRAVMELVKAFCVSKGQSRGRWIRGLFNELHGLRMDEMVSGRLSLPTSMARACRLNPFACAYTGAKNAAQVESVCIDASSTWSWTQRLLLLYGHFVASVLVCLPGDHMEVELMLESCRRFFDLEIASVISTIEHGGADKPKDFFASCVSSTLTLALVQSLTVSAKAERVEAMQESFRQQVGELAVAAKQGLEAMAIWLIATAENWMMVAERKHRCHPPLLTQGLKRPRLQGKDERLTPVKQRRGLHGGILNPERRDKGE